MVTEIKSPTYPESVADGTISNWVKKEGQEVKQDELIAEIETDKIVLEVLSPINGKIQKIIRLHCDNKIKIIYSESEVYLLNSLRDSKNVEFILKGKSYKKYINHLEFLFILLLPLYFFVPIFIFVRKFLFKIFKKSSLERKKIDFVFFSNTSSFEKLIFAPIFL